MKKFLLLLVIVFLSSCEKEVHPIIDSDLKSIDQIRQLELYEYDKIGNDKNGDKTIFFSNVKPDYILKGRKDYPLGRLKSYSSKNSEVLKYFDQELKNEFIYYQFRNDSLISRLYIIDNFLKENVQVIKLNKVKKILDSLKINYSSTGSYENLLRNKFNYKTPTTDDVFLINNKYPAIIHATPKLFYIEVFYNKNDNFNSIWSLEN
ncbi:hypothetical protein SAMN05421857_1531 [Chryseobacterium formosense]|nr:hypothetical protein SAMN05421857_1531 [Chryseobacterium formosense]